MTQKITFLINRLLAAQYSNTGQPTDPLLGQEIASLTPLAEVQAFWCGVAEAANMGKVPPHGRSWDLCAQLWPTEIRRLVVPLLQNSHPRVRSFALFLLKEWNKGQGLIIFDDILSALKLGNYNVYVGHPLDLLPSRFSLHEVQSLKETFQSVTDATDREKICKWLRNQQIEDLYEVTIYWLGEEANDDTIMEIANILRGGAGYTSTLRAQAARITSERLRHERSNVSLCRALLQVLVASGTVDEVVAALRGSGDWLDMSAITPPYGWHSISDKLVAALSQVWRQSPPWWRGQLEAEWCRDLLREGEFLTHRGRHFPTFLLPCLLRSAPWLSRTGTDSIEGVTEIDPDTLQPLPRFFGMPLADRVSTIEVDRLRFAFLFTQAVVGQTQQPASLWLQDHEFITAEGMHQIGADEQLCDQQEAQWAEMIARALAQLRQVEGAPISDATWAALEAVRYWIWSAPLEEGEAERSSLIGLFEQFEGLSPHVVEILSSLYRQLQETQSQTYLTARRNLVQRSLDWTQRIAEIPPEEFPLRFPQLRWEGVLGEYFWKAQQILLYLPMMEWIARDIARETRLLVDVVSQFIHDIVMGHEAIHAVVHLGLDSTGRWWENPGEASLAFHESLTEWMLRLWLLHQLDPQGRKVHSAIANRLPEIYRFGSLLPEVSAPGVLDAVRYSLLTRGKRLPDILKVVARVIDYAVEDCIRRAILRELYEFHRRVGPVPNYCWADGLEVFRKAADRRSEEDFRRATAALGRLLRERLILGVEGSDERVPGRVAVSLNPEHLEEVERILSVGEVGNFQNTINACLNVLRTRRTVREQTESIIQTVKQLASIPWVWHEIATSDPELMRILTTPHLLECSAFATACQSTIPAGDSFRVLTLADMQQHVDALVFRQRDEERNQLMQQLTHLNNLLSMLVKEQRKLTETTAGDIDAQEEAP